MKNLSSLSRREKDILYITVTIVFIAITYNFLILPFIRKSKELKQEVKQQELQYKKSIQILERAENLKQWRQSLPFKMGASEIKEDNLTKILSYIEEFSQKANVKIINISPGKLEEHQDYRLMFIEITLSGVAENIVEFVYALESSPFMFSVENMQITSAGEQTVNVQVFLEISKLIII